MKSINLHMLCAVLLLLLLGGCNDSSLPIATENRNNYPVEGTAAKESPQIILQPSPSPTPIEQNILTLKQCIGSWSSPSINFNHFDGTATIYIFSEQEMYYIDMVVETPENIYLLADDLYVSDIGDLWISNYYDDGFGNYGYIAITPGTDLLYISISADGCNYEIPSEDNLKMHSVPFSFTSSESTIKTTIDLYYQNYDAKYDDDYNSWGIEDPYADFSEFEYKTMLEQQYGVFVPQKEYLPEPNDILRNFDMYLGKPVMYNGYVKWVNTYEFGPKSFLIEESSGGFIIQCYSSANIPIVIGDYIKVYGEPDYITSYTSTNSNGYSQELPTFNLNVRFYTLVSWTRDSTNSYIMTEEEKNYFFNHPYKENDGEREFYLTETSINGESYEVESVEMEGIDIVLTCRTNNQKWFLRLMYSGVVSISWLEGEIYYGNVPFKGPYYFHNADIHFVK